MRIYVAALLVPLTVFQHNVSASEKISPINQSLQKNGTVLKWAGCGITKHAFMDELSKAYEKKTGVKIVFDKGNSPLDGSISGIQNINNGEFQLGASCRANIESLPEERNVYQVPVAWDAIVFITHPSNPVESITTKQAQDIYMGRVTNWKQLGGPDATIELFDRSGKLSGVGRNLRELLFANYDQEFVNVRHIVPSTGPLEKGIESTPYSLGATGISSAHRRKVKILNLNDKEPNFENIRTGQYLMYRPLYLVSKGYNADPIVKDFVTFAISREGQDVIRKTGTVPYTDSLGLVMKQIEEYDVANKKGLFSTATDQEIKKR